MALFQKIFDSVLNRTMAYPFHPRLDGFEDPKGMDVSYDYTTRRVTLTHASGTVAIWHKGLRYLYTSPYSPTAAHTAANGSYFLTLRDGGVFTWDTSPFDLENQTPVAYAWHDITNGVYFGIRECHGLEDWETHLEFHEKIGTYRRSGGLLTAGTYVVGTGGDTDANVTPGTDQVVVADEDLPTTITALTQGSYTRMHFISSVAVFNRASALPFPYTGNSPQINTSGTSLTTISSNNTYYNLYVIYVPVTSDAESQKYKVLWLPGQTTYTSLATAQAEDFRSINMGNFTGVATEFVPFVQITYRYNSAYGGTARVRIEAEPAYLTGSRASLVSLTGIVSSTHNNLSGRTDPSCHPASAIDVAATTGRALTDLQSYIDVYPKFHDYLETVSGSAKTVFTLDYDILAEHKIDVSIDGREQPIENTNWTRDVVNNRITTSEAVQVGSVFKARIHLI